MEDRVIETFKRIVKFISITLVISSLLSSYSYSAEKDVSLIIPKLKHKEWKVRNEAALELGDMKDLCSIVPLVAALKRETGRWANIAWALGKMGEPAIEPLLTMLKNGNEYDRIKAANTLVRLWVSSDNAVRSSIVQSLSAMLKDEQNEDIKGAAAWALALIETPQAQTAVDEFYMKKGVYLDAIVKNYKSILNSGKKYDEWSLVVALDRYANTKEYEQQINAMAKDLLNCGNKKIEYIVEAGALTKGLDVIRYR